MIRQGYVPVSCVRRSPQVSTGAECNSDGISNEAIAGNRPCLVAVTDFFENKDRPWEVSVGEGDSMTSLASNNKVSRLEI